MRADRFLFRVCRGEKQQREHHVMGFVANLQQTTGEPAEKMVAAQTGDDHHQELHRYQRATVKVRQIHRIGRHDEHRQKSDDGRDDEHFIVNESRP